MAPADKDDSKRRRNALSCAECRRLKLKCDRTFPCSSCRKRGCAAICPDGALTTGKLGGRFILANTEQLHEKISDLQSRINDLEEALAVSHATHSNQTHPLLRPELLALKVPLGAEIVGRGSTGSPKDDSSESPQEGLESFGTLTINEDGAATFYGNTVASEFLIEPDDNEEDGATCSIIRPMPWLPTDLSHLAHSFPFATLTESPETIKFKLRSFLPSLQEGLHLTDCYFKNAAWMYNPLNEQQFYDEIFAPLYDTIRVRSITSHALAVAYAVFALGALVDLDRPPYHPDAEKFYVLARASLAIECCLEITTMNAIQALILMAYFNQMTDKRNAPALTWSQNGLAMKLAQAIGLHRDWEKWGLPMGEVALRRKLMWECICFDTWSAFSFGRPPSQALNFVDCKKPEDPKIPEQPMEGFYKLKSEFAEILLDVINVTFGATPPQYTEICRLDRKLRDWYIPPLFQASGINEDDKPRHPSSANPSLGLSLQGLASALWREVALLYLHRSFFAKALSEHPEDPFKSRYAVSVLAAHRSACATIMLVRRIYSLEPRLIIRAWYFWVHSFTASIILASIVTKAPQLSLAPSSMTHVEMTLDLFKQAANGSRPANTLPVLQEVRAKAYEVYSQYTKSPSDRGKSTTPPGGGDDKLEPMLSGKTRLVSKKKRNTSGDAATPPGKQEEARDEKPAPTWFLDSSIDVHPTLLEHLKMHESGSNAMMVDSPDVKNGGSTARFSPQSFSSPPAPAPATSNPPLPTFNSGFGDHWGANMGTTSQDVLGLASGTTHELHKPSFTSFGGNGANMANMQQNHYTTQMWDNSTSPVSPTFPPQQQASDFSQAPFGANTFSLSNAAQNAGSSTATPGLPRNFHQQDMLYQLNVAQQVPGWDRLGNFPVHQMLPGLLDTPSALTHPEPSGGLLHSGGVNELERDWRSFLLGVDFPTSMTPSRR